MTREYQFTHPKTFNLARTIYAPISSNDYSKLNHLDKKELLLSFLGEDGEYYIDFMVTPEVEKMNFELIRGELSAEDYRERVLEIGFELYEMRLDEIFDEAAEEERAWNLERRNNYSDWRDSDNRERSEDMRLSV